MQRIEEVERGSTPIQVDHVRSSAERKTEEVSSREKKSQDITNEGRVDNFEGPGEMQRRRRSLSKAGRSRDTSRARETITSAINAKENKKSKASGTRSSSRGREMVVERREERRERGRSRARDLQVPMTLRQPFLDDPFYKGTLKSLESTRDDFFKQARQSFEESLKQMESRMSNALSLTAQGSNDSLFAKDWMMKPPAPLRDNFGRMECQPPAPGAGKFGEECRSSNECNIHMGLCCRLQRRQKMQPKKLCTYYTDPEVCIGPVASAQNKRVMQHTAGEKRMSAHPDHSYLRYRR